MSFDDIQNLWQSPHNQPTPSDMEKQKTEFIRKLRSEYRGFTLRMSFIFAGLTYITAKIINRLFTQQSLGLDRSHSIDLSSEWALIPLLGLPWLAAILFVRQHLRHRRAHADYQSSILSSLSATLDSTVLALKRIKIMVALHLLSIPIAAVCIQQLHRAGKVRSHELTSMIVLFSAIILIALVCFAIGYFRQLLPRRRQLEQLRQSYQE